MCPIYFSSAKEWVKNRILIKWGNKGNGFMYGPKNFAPKKIKMNTKSSCTEIKLETQGCS